MDWHLTSETFWLPIFHLMPREPTLPKPPDRHPIKEYNDLSRSLSLYALWLISKLTCLSSAFPLAGRMDPFPPHTADFALTLKMVQELFISRLFLPPLYICSEKRSTIAASPVSLHPHPLLALSLSHFAHQARLDLSQRGSRGAEEGEVWPPSESEGWSVDSLRIP